MLLLLLLLFRNGNIFFFGDERMSRYIRLSLEKRISLRIKLLNSSRFKSALCFRCCCSVQKKVLLLVQGRKTPRELTVVVVVIFFLFLSIYEEILRGGKVASEVFRVYGLRKVEEVSFLNFSRKRAHTSLHILTRLY